MLVVDVNVLVDAHRPDGRQHEAVRQWLEAAYRGDELLGIPGHVASGFVRIVTNRRIFDHPTPVVDALAFIEALHASPSVLRIEPGPAHWGLFADICRLSRSAGDLVPDAWLAALTIENRATLITSDRGFGRYPGLKWRDPLADV
jgi:toxin-antitoxin system PIN domain toxin